MAEINALKKNLYRLNKILKFLEINKNNECFKNLDSK